MLGLTWTSFSPSATRLTMLIRSVLSGFGFFLYSASRMAWSSGLGRVTNSAYTRADGLAGELDPSRHVTSRHAPGSTPLLPSERLIVDAGWEILPQRVGRVHEKGEAVVGRLLTHGGCLCLGVSMGGMNDMAVSRGCRCCTGPNSSTYTARDRQAPDKDVRLIARR